MILTFPQALELRDALIGLGWAPDLIAIEAYGQDIGSGRPPQGYQVVLAWANGRLKRVRSMDEAQPHFVTRDSKSQEPLGRVLEPVLE